MHVRVPPLAGRRSSSRAGTPWLQRVLADACQETGVHSTWATAARGCSVASSGGLVPSLSRTVPLVTDIMPRSATRLAGLRLLGEETPLRVEGG